MNNPEHAIAAENICITLLRVSELSTVRGNAASGYHQSQKAAIPNIEGIRLRIITTPVLPDRSSATPAMPNARSGKNAKRVAICLSTAQRFGKPAGIAHFGPKHAAAAPYAPGSGSFFR